MSKSKSGLTKVAKGIAFGDVSNYAVRNVLTEISRQLYGEFTKNKWKKLWSILIGVVLILENI